MLTLHALDFKIFKNRILLEEIFENSVHAKLTCIYIYTYLNDRNIICCIFQSHLFCIDGHLVNKVEKKTIGKLTNIVPKILNTNTK